MIENKEVTLNHPDGQVVVGPPVEGLRSVAVTMREPGAFVSFPTCVTRYAPDLIEKILAVKGPAYLCDEIRRDEDPAYVRERLQQEIGFFVDLKDLAGKRLLDFGCGSGASTFSLARLIPDAEIVGVELDPDFVAIAEARKRYYFEEDIKERRSSENDGYVTSAPSPLRGEGWGEGDLARVCSAVDSHHFLSRNLCFLLSPSGTTLPAGLAPFDFIVLSAVYEHLLPAERQPVLAALWSALRPGGILFINQTPNRWFPVEQHTTGLPLLNYLPDRLACALAKTWSHREVKADDWPTLLRKGIRGGSECGIADELAQVGAVGVDVLRPTRFGASDGIDLWYRMSAPRWRLVKKGLWLGFKTIAFLTGVYLVPAYLVMAIRKKG